MPYGFPLLVTLMLIVPAYGVVPIPYVSEDHIQLDGELDDWSELLGPPLLTASDFSLWQGAPMHEKPLYVDFDPDICQMTSRFAQLSDIQIRAPLVTGLGDVR